MKLLFLNLSLFLSTHIHLSARLKSVTLNLMDLLTVKPIPKMCCLSSQLQYSTRSPFVTLLSQHAQSDRRTSYREMGVVHRITYSR